ncbi:CAP domain-containing protein [Butyrivibrio sp. JL13D10]|uniref:CAP domain-containing protein n=1 Tax=Butyrivibrio sp. JL13D10 TaxID=3236815 RepID=UPI0038B5C4CD
MNKRAIGLLKLYVCACIICMLMIIGGMTARAKTVNTSEVVSYMNELRKEMGLPAFTVSESLNQSAAVRAKELKVKFAHTRPDGTAWYTVGQGVNGENLARADKESEKESLNIIAAWFLSPSHKANLLSSSTQIGIASFEDENGYAYIACEFN